VPPVARFTSTTDGLTVNTDGSTSTDSDGTITAYSWTYGTAGTGTGATSSYTFPAAGTYPVTLTVTDNTGATDTTTQNITVTAPPSTNVLAADTFTRTVSSGWGTAESGGAWTAVGGASSLSVSGGQGVMTLHKGETREAQLSGLSATRAEASVRFSSNVASAGGAASVTLIGRRVGSNWYGVRARLEPGGVMRMYLLPRRDLPRYLCPSRLLRGWPAAQRQGLGDRNQSDNRSREDVAGRRHGARCLAGDRNRLHAGHAGSGQRLPPP